MTVSVMRVPASGAIVLTKTLRLQCGQIKCFTRNALLALLSKGAGKANKSELRGAVVGLAEVAVEASGRGGHDDATETLLAHDVPSSARHGVGAVEVNTIDDIPLSVSH